MRSILSIIIGVLGGAAISQLVLFHLYWQTALAFSVTINVFMFKEIWYVLHQEEGVKKQEEGQDIDDLITATKRLVHAMEDGRVD